MAKKQIYVVDDNEVAREVARAVLEDAGHEVQCFGSGFQLNAAIRDQRPDLILLDVCMPALGGEQVAQILERYEFSRGIPIILYSELPDAELIALTRLIGAHGFIRKSTATSRMASEVAEYLDSTAVATPVS